jgi:colanic acid biosynthesis protein WcaH
MSLSREEFLAIVAATPLASIDLVIRSERNRVLLGKRTNRPAQGFWFVPGGRIWKNETIDTAFKRICRAELGVELAPGKLIGAFDHIYPDNFYGAPGINTHYVVLAFECVLEEAAVLSGDAQHEAMQWWDHEAARNSPEVHENTRRYLA